MQSLLAALALPQYGLSTVFVVALVSATLLPMGSEPLVFGMVTLNPALFWPTIGVATLGNTLGGAVSWWMGRGAQQARARWRSTTKNPAHLSPKTKPLETRALRWLQRLGPKACLLSWLPGIGDPLCALAGWLHLPFWPCVAYMALGKFTRYVMMTSGLIWASSVWGALSL